jgi:hypothetical protein
VQATSIECSKRMLIEPQFSADAGATRNSVRVSPLARGTRFSVPY